MPANIYNFIKVYKGYYLLAKDVFYIVLSGRSSALSHKYNDYSCLAIMMMITIIIIIVMIITLKK